jgi:hypothetical protein
MTTNRKLTLELAWYVVPAYKIGVLNSYFCYRDHTAEFRLKFPYYPARADLFSSPPVQPDLDYILALTESDTVVNMRYGVLFLLALSSLSVYSIILAGWASNSKYAFIGALRSAAQMISYEVAISLILLPVVLLAGSLNFTMITYMQSITV